MDKIRVGIFFGGPSREREISFAGGRTVYDNLNKFVFEPIPIFIDHDKEIVVLDWSYVYKGTIRDFYPPVQFLPASPHGFQIYAESIQDAPSMEMRNSVGRAIDMKDLPQLIDVAFLALHGYYGEDGQIQAILESLQIPYTGSGIMPCAIGMDKGVQKKLMQAAGFACPTMIGMDRSATDMASIKKLYAEVLESIGTSMVVRPANQGSSIGVSIMHDPSFEDFAEAILHAFFIKEIDRTSWTNKTLADKVAQIRLLSDIREGIGFPLITADGMTIYHPEELLTYLDAYLATNEKARLESYHTERSVIVEQFIEGREFSCIVLRNTDGSPVALPPTEIRKQGQLYDYKSKYLPGLSRKITPIDLPQQEIERIRVECQKLYKYLSFNTYARIDGFYATDGHIYLNDPNTTSGMMPSSFFFHQAAEIGLDPSQFLSYIIRTSIVERVESLLYRSHSFDILLQKLDDKLAQLQEGNTTKKKVAVILGGYSFERHISVESGRNIYEKLASSDKYLPVPIFLKKKEDSHELYLIPINLLLKDNADDIAEKIDHFNVHPILDVIKGSCTAITQKYQSSLNISLPQKITYPDLAKLVDAAFIALHGRPGEDGTVQQNLKEVGIPYNGSPTESAQITIDKYKTLQLLKAQGFVVADQFILGKEQFVTDEAFAISQLEQYYKYPFIVKPVDDGCSSAVKVIKNRDMLEVYLSTLFRESDAIPEVERTKLGLAYNEEFPRKEEVLIENLIHKGDASHFLEITGGLLTHYDEGKVTFEMFEPSEALAGGEILSLEEKFLAGEGQNLTPARFGEQYDTVATQVKDTLQRAAQILGVEGYARIDAFVRVYPDMRAETIIIEVNSLPGMTPATCIFHQTAINGYRPYEFIDKILEYAIKKQKR